jgi:hypothetical protein
LAGMGRPRRYKPLNLTVAAQKSHDPPRIIVMGIVPSRVAVATPALSVSARAIVFTFRTTARLDLRNSHPGALINPVCLAVARSPRITNTDLCCSWCSLSVLTRRSSKLTSKLPALADVIHFSLYLIAEPLFGSGVPVSLGGTPGLRMLASVAWLH